MSRMALTGGTTGGQVALSALWLALYAQWLTVPSIILPDQVAGILGGGDPAAREAVTGLVVAAGAAMSLVVTPLAGALSDRTRAARGRRRPFLLWGLPAGLVALGLLGVAGRSGSLLLYGLAYAHLQFWWNVAAGPYAGLIPDVVPPDRQAMASGWMNAILIAGVVAGNLLVLACYTPGRPALVFALFAVLALVCLWVTLRVPSRRHSAMAAACARSCTASGPASASIGTTTWCWSPGC